MAKAKSEKVVFYGTGRRKKAIARVRLVDGKGNITINGKNIDEYFGMETLKVIVKQPLVLTTSVFKGSLPYSEPPIFLPRPSIFYN